MGEVPLHGPELTGAPEGDGHSACSGLQSRHDWERKMHLVKRYGVLIAGCSGFERSHLCLLLSSLFLSSLELSDTTICVPCVCAFPRRSESGRSLKCSDTGHQPAQTKRKAASLQGPRRSGGPTSKVLGYVARTRVDQNAACGCPPTGRKPAQTKLNACINWF